MNLRHYKLPMTFDIRNEGEHLQVVEKESRGKYTYGLFRVLHKSPNTALKYLSGLVAEEYKRRGYMKRIRPFGRAGVEPKSGILTQQFIVENISPKRAIHKKKTPKTENLPQGYIDLLSDNYLKSIEKGPWAEFVLRRDIHPWVESIRRLSTQNSDFNIGAVLMLPSELDSAFLRFEYENDILIAFKHKGVFNDPYTCLHYAHLPKWTEELMMMVADKPEVVKIRNIARV